VVVLANNGFQSDDCGAKLSSFRQLSMHKMRWLLAITGIVILFGLAFAHWILPGRIESAHNVSLVHDAYLVSTRASQLHDSLFIADLHSDSLLWKRNLIEKSSIGHMDLPRLREGNVALQVFSATTKSPAGQNYESNESDSDNITLLAIASFWPVRTWGSLFERAVYQLEKLHDIARRSELTVLTSKRDMRDFVSRRYSGEQVIGGIYLIEGAHPLEGDLENLETLFGQGLRIIGLTHFFDNELGGSLHGTSREGLNAFGRSVIHRANELGLIIDVAHASPQMVTDVLAISSRPVLLSHGGVKGSCDSARNLDDSLMQDIANNGGLIGIGYWAGAVCDVTPEGVVKAIRYAIDLLGIRHVALGSDYDGSTAVLFDTGELAILTEEMLRAGFTESEIRMVMGENVKRFLLENLPD
jgi:microsomal dipeptidase-like Zn-dependent dipeptidase